MSTSDKGPVIGVLALQGAFEEHQHCLHAVGCQTRQVRTIQQLQGLDGIVLPGGESTAMGLIGTSTDDTEMTLWQALQQFDKPIWGTCAGMILLAERCIGTSAVIQDGQALIGGVDITVCRNYFGSQVSSFEMPIPAPDGETFPGIFIRAPAILTAGPDVTVLGKVVATPCRQAAVTLAELERKIAAGENVVKLGVQDALDRSSENGQLKYRVVMDDHNNDEEKKADSDTQVLVLPGAANGSTAREVICAVRKNNVLCTAFHPELTDDYRWHQYFADMVRGYSSNGDV